MPTADYYDKEPIIIWHETADLFVQPMHLLNTEKNGVG